MKKGKYILAVLVMTLCMFTMAAGNTVFAALATNVTGDDIINTGLTYSTDSRYNYNNIGTCTGFVTRVLNKLGISQDIVGVHPYNIDVPQSGGGARYSPDLMYTNAQRAVANGTAKFIWSGSKSKVAANSELFRNGDLIITRIEDKNPRTGTGHVAFIRIVGDTIYSFGANGMGSGIGNLLLARGVKTYLTQSLGLEEFSDEGIMPFGDDGGTGDVLNIYRLVEDEIYGNIKITKKLSGSDIDPTVTNLAGVQFKAVSDKGEEFFSNVSGDDGICLFEHLAKGTYTIIETQCPINAIKVDNFTCEISENGKTYEYTKTDKRKTMQIEITKDFEDLVKGKTDAKLEGVVFTVYSDEACTKQVTTLRIDANNYGKSVKLPVQTYYVKETYAPEGINLDANIPGDTMTYREKVYVFTAENSRQEPENAIYSQNIKNMSNIGAIYASKYNNDETTTENSPAKGAILKITLKSTKGTDHEVSYEAVVNDVGRAEFINVDLVEYKGEYTIPYGEYELTEVKPSDNGESYFYHIQGQDKKLEEDSKRICIGIVSDNPTDAHIKITKFDLDQNTICKQAGFKYKVWNCQTNEWINQVVTPVGLIDEFETNDEGTLLTPQTLTPGRYVVYETAVPENSDYYIPEEYKVPENASDYGNTAVSGVEVIIDKVAAGLASDAIYDQGNHPYVAVEMKNPVYKGKIEIFKKAEMLSDAKSTNSKYGDVYTPIYEEKPLQNAKFDVVAAEDILTPDGKYVRVHKDEVVATVTTGEDGIAVTDELYLGKYNVVEKEVPAGVILDTTPHEVVLTRSKTEDKVSIEQVSVTDVRQKLSLSIVKVFKDVEYSLSKVENLSAVFGVHAADDIYNCNGEKIIDKDALVFVMEYKDGKVSNEGMDLPQGTYYIEELETSVPYIVNTKIVSVPLEYKGTEEYLDVFAGEFINTSERTTSIKLFKMTSDSTGEVTYDGNRLVDSTNNDRVQEIISGLSEIDSSEYETYLAENNIQPIPGAEYRLYGDKACTKPVYHKLENGEYEEAKFYTNDAGLIQIDNIPIGVYFLKETVAPRGYERTPDPLKLDLIEDDKDAIVVKLMRESDALHPYITKTDIFDGEVVPNCTFEILDSDGTVIQYSKTDDEGKAYIVPRLFIDGEKYYLHEIDAPGIYNLNPDLHEFIAHVNEDENIWTGSKEDRLKVENYRKDATVTLIKTDLVDSTLIPDCKFELRSVDNPEWVVEGVTDKDGVYVFENVPYGVYTYTELEAPEKYKIDTTPHEFTVNKDNVILEVTNELKDTENAPTGDIAVFALAGIALVSVLGIAFVVVRKKARN